MKYIRLFIIFYAIIIIGCSKKIIHISEPETHLARLKLNKDNRDCIYLYYHNEKFYFVSTDLMKDTTFREIKYE